MVGGEGRDDDRERGRRQDGARDALPARAVVSQAESVAMPPARLATVNSAIPDRYTRRWPNRSAARPPSSRNPAKVST